MHRSHFTEREELNTQMEFIRFLTTDIFIVQGFKWNPLDNHPA